MSPSTVVSLLALLLAFSLTDAKDIYVSLGGSDFPGCGSQAQPCLDVFYAVDQEASANDVILVAPGDYAVDPSDSVSISMNLTFAPSVPQEGPPTFNFREMCPDNAVFQVSASSAPVYVSFSDFQFENLNCNSPGGSMFSLSASGSIASLSLSSTNFIQNSFNNKTAGSLIYVPDSAGQVQLLISGTEFGLNAGTVINITSSITSLSINATQFQQNSGIAISAGLDGSQTASSKVLIENCNISQNEIGVAVGVNYQVTIENSSITSNTETDVDCQGASLNISKSDIGTFTCYSVGSTDCTINSENVCYY